jgi:hypothetical protein
MEQALQCLLDRRILENTEIVVESVNFLANSFDLC